MIFQLIYRSTATRQLTPNELLELLEQSRIKNARLNITGMLLFHGGCFMQLLEGDETVVRDLYSTIAADARHHWVTLVMTGPNGARDFPDWTMGFRDLGKCQPPAEGWSTFLDCTDLPPNLAAASSYIRNIFLAFRALE